MIFSVCASYFSFVFSGLQKLLNSLCNSSFLQETTGSAENLSTNKNQKYTFHVACLNSKTELFSGGQTRLFTEGLFIARPAASSNPKPPGLNS